MQMWHSQAKWGSVGIMGYATQAGRDALAKAPTGSGKTLAYLAAIIHDLQSQEPHLSRAEGSYAIIMAPTRELCIQICDVLTLILRRFIWLVTDRLLPCPPPPLSPPSFMLPPLLTSPGQTACAAVGSHVMALHVFVL